MLGLPCCAGLSPAAASGGLSDCAVQASHCDGSSAGQALAWLLCGMWDPPRPATEPMSPVLTGRFLIPGPPGKFLFKHI